MSYSMILSSLRGGVLEVAHLVRAWQTIATTFYVAISTAC
jgi:hypothetical protein